MSLDVAFNFSVYFNVAIDKPRYADATFHSNVESFHPQIIKDLIQFIFMNGFKNLH